MPTMIAAAFLLHMLVAGALVFYGYREIAKGHALRGLVVSILVAVCVVAADYYVGDFLSKSLGWSWSLDKQLVIASAVGAAVGLITVVLVFEPDYVENSEEELKLEV